MQAQIWAVQLKVYQFYIRFDVGNLYEIPLSFRVEVMILTDFCRRRLQSWRDWMHGWCPGGQSSHKPSTTLTIRYPRR